MLSAENSNGWGLRPKAAAPRRSFEIPKPTLFSRTGRQSESRYDPPLVNGADGSRSASQEFTYRPVDNDWHESAARHQLSYSGAGRFWKPPDEQGSRGGRSWWRRDRASTTSNHPLPYIHPHPPPANSPVSMASSQTFDRQSSIDGARSHAAESSEAWERQSISSIQHSAAEEAELVSTGARPRVLQPGAQNHKVAQDDRQRKTALHLLQVFEKEEERVRQLAEAEDSPSKPVPEIEIDSGAGDLHEKAADEIPLYLPLDIPHHGESWSAEKVLTEIELAVPSPPASATLQTGPEYSAKIVDDGDLPIVYQERQPRPNSDDPEVFNPPEKNVFQEVDDVSHNDSHGHSMFADLNLIKQRLPNRYSNVSPSSVLLLPSYLNELSTSQSVIHRPKTNDSTSVQSSRKLPNLKKYNTLPDEPPPLPNQLKMSESEGEAQQSLVNVQIPPNQEQSLATTGMMVNIEPDIDPRTGKRYAGPVTTGQQRLH